MGREVSLPPEPIRSAIAELWRRSNHTEEDTFNSGAFGLLEVNCGFTYSGIEGSRLSQQPADDWDRMELRGALENFFRWNGAPWYDGPSPDADETALRLHQAFLATEVKRTYFAPLDRLDLLDRTQRPWQTLEHIRFGPNEVLLLKSADLARRVRPEVLKRFGRWYCFQTEKLDGFYWLIVSACEEAGPIWKRHAWSAMFHMTFDAVGREPLFKSTYPAPIEDALFVLLLSLGKEPSEPFWKPFAVPWTYSVTDDLFARPPRAPDPLALTWTLIGPPDDEFEAPDRSEIFETTREQFEAALEQQWRRLQAASARDNTDRANFHPLTKHFFVKALAQEGIDEILADISCIEATLQLLEEKTRKKLMGRYKRLVSDRKALQWLDDAYDLRKKHLHSLGDLKETFSWEDLAQARWSVTKAVDDYLALTEAQSNLNREELLRSLKS